MKRLLCVGLLAPAMPLGCTKSVNQARHDVDRAHDQAVKNVDARQRELNDEKRRSEERIAQKERRVEDAARDGNDKIIKEERSLEDAQKAEARRHEPSTTTPEVDRGPAPAVNQPTNRPADVDVNVGGGRGVRVDVNRNPQP